MSSLPDISLKDAVEFIVDNRGKTAPTESSGIALIATNCVNNNDLYPRKENLRFVSQDTYDNWFRAHPKPRDILLTNKGSQNGAICLVPDIVDFCIAQDMVALRANSSILEPLYLFAALRSELVQNRIKALNVDAVIPHFKKTDFDKLFIPLPDRNTQQFIGNCYFELSSRIQLLKETNATLEAIAQALFKSWFVDFDPVHAKQQGRLPEGMDEQTAALFPDSFEESIPKGWTIDSIYEIAQVIYGAPFASSKFNSDKIGRGLIRIRDLKNEAPGVFTEEVHPKGYIVQPGDIVVGMDGEFRAYLWGGELSWLNQRCCVFQPIKDISTAYIRFSIMPLLAAVEASETATTVIHLGKNDIDRFRVIVPSTEVLKAFGEVANPLYEKIVASKQMATTLVDLRDTLLPRLISGQLRVGDVSVESQ
jgi:type I restriction enzyme S subunit